MDKHESRYSNRIDRIKRFDVMKFEKLGNIAEIIAGQSPPSSTYNKDGDGIPFFQGKADYGKIYPVVRNWCTKPTKISLPNDILISVRAPVGPVNINNVEACIGRGLSAIRVKDNFSMQYVFSFLKANEIKIANLGVGSTFTAITQKDLKNLIIPTPDYPTQLHIANILSKAESLIAQRKESIRLLDEYLKSVFLEMFGESSLNEKNWPKVELKHFGKISTGNTPSRSDSENYSTNHIEWIKTDNIQENQMVITQALEYLSEIGLSKARKIEKGALLVACIAGSIESIGRACVTDRTVTFNQQINAIQPNKDFESLFLYWLFKINRKYIQNHATKGMKKILTKGEFESIKMINPPLELQAKFAQIVEKTEALKTQYQQSLQELENLYGSLSQKAFKGELIINDERLLMAAEPETKYGEK